MYSSVRLVNISSAAGVESEKPIVRRTRAMERRSWWEMESGSFRICGIAEDCLMCVLWMWWYCRFWRLR